MKSIDSTDSMPPTVINMALLCSILLTDISCLQFMAPSSYVYSAVAELCLDLRLKLPAVLSTSPKSRSALIDWQHMIKQPKKLGILVQCKLELK